MSELDLNKEGAYKAHIKIKATPVIPEVPAGGKPVPFFLELEGQTKKLKVWPNQVEKLALPLEEGREGEAEIKVTSRVDNRNQTVIEAWLMSFGGENKGFKKGFGGGGYGGGKTYTPKTDAEIHSPSIAGIIKSAMEFCAEDNSNFEELCQMGFKMYNLGLSMVAPSQTVATPAPVQPAAAPAPAPEAKKEDPDKARKEEASAHWEVMQGTKAELAQLQKLCKDLGLRSYEIILTGKATGKSPFELIKLLGGIPGAGQIEPGDHRNPVPKASTNSSETSSVSHREYEDAITALVRKLGFPTWVQALEPWQPVFKIVLGRDVKRPAVELGTAEFPDDFAKIYAYLMDVESGAKQTPGSFSIWKKDQGVAA